MNQIRRISEKINTPWGVTDFSELVAKGIKFVSTPSHGGYLIDKQVAEGRIPLKVLKSLFVKVSENSPYYAFEEDCDAVLVPLFFPEITSPENRELALAMVKGMKSYFEKMGVFLLEPIAGA